MSDERKPGGIILTDEQLARLTSAPTPGIVTEPMPCGELAPAAVNGGARLECLELRGHEGVHVAVIRWGRTS
jgi:hypothetical protein